MSIWNVLMPFKSSDRTKEIYGEMQLRKIDWIKKIDSNGNIVKKSKSKKRIKIKKSKSPLQLNLEVQIKMEEIGLTIWQGALLARNHKLDGLSDDLIEVAIAIDELIASNAPFCKDEGLDGFVRRHSTCEK